jgi:hypothetical protein
MTEDVMISLLADATRIACGHVTPQHLNALHASVDQAAGTPARPDWGRKAAAHAEIFNVLADMAPDRGTNALLNRGTGFACALLTAAGRAADGMTASSRDRFLSSLHLEEWEDAALEMEKHFRALRFMWRLANPPARRQQSRRPQYSQAQVGQRTGTYG